jgi:transposase-like protein
MKEAKKLSREEKQEVCRERFEEGKSGKELAEKYGVCHRTIIRISNKYRKEGKGCFEKKAKGEKKESAEEKIKRLERENEMLRDIHKVLSELSKKK